MERKKDTKEIALRSATKKTATNILEETFKRVEEYQKIMEQFQSIQNNLLGNVVGVFPGEIKAWGTSAHIPFQRKYAGRKVKILLLEEEKQEENKS